MIRSLSRFRRPTFLIKFVTFCMGTWILLDMLSVSFRDGYQAPGQADIAHTDYYLKSGLNTVPPLIQKRSQYSRHPMFDDVIIYNRVPKCASTSMRRVMSELANKNKFTLHVSKTFAQEVLNETGQRAFAKRVSGMERPLLFIRHIFFVNFTSYNVQAPMYINMIREPLDRHVSDYYFKRYNLKHMFPMSERKRQRTYNECVQGNYSECTGDRPSGYYRIIPYFCGQHPKCFVPGDESLSQAKQNVEKHFPVVGVVEYVNEFLQVLEKKIPHYFTGAAMMYNAGGDRFKQMAKTKKKDPVQEQTKTIMRQKLKYDYDFYNFVKQRFKQQYRELYQKDLIDVNF